MPLRRTTALARASGPRSASARVVQASLDRLGGAGAQPVQLSGIECSQRRAVPLAIPRGSRTLGLAPEAPSAQGVLAVLVTQRPLKVSSSRLLPLNVPLLLDLSADPPFGLWFEVLPDGVWP